MPDRKTLDRLISERRCQRCQKHNDQHPMSRCSLCSAQEKASRRQRVEDGRCMKCGRPKVMEEATRLCRSCLDNRFNW